MLSGLRWLALEVWFLDRAREFYAEHLDLPVRRADDHEVVLDTGGAALVLRAPGPVPRGGVHVHYALATTRAHYGEYFAALSATLDVSEVDFGGARSLYFYDPDDHCVELGERAAGDDPVDGFFEVVLEVEDLARAESFYRDLGFSVVDRGETRRRVRLTGPVDLELWEPQRGLADARGGVHVDLGFTSPDPEAAVRAVADRVCSVETLDDGRRVRDPNGHYLTFERG